jgi:hypothetical protein
MRMRRGRYVGSNALECRLRLRGLSNAPMPYAKAHSSEFRVLISSTASLTYGGKKLPINVSGLQSSETELEHIMQKRKKNGEYTGSLLG